MKEINEKQLMEILRSELNLEEKALQENYSNNAVKLGLLEKPWIANFTTSEQITIFAETQILFSYYSTIFYLIFFLIIKYSLKTFKHYKDTNYQIISMFILITYFDWLTCFGLDFFLVQLFYNIFFLMVIFIIYKIKIMIKK